MFHARKCNRLFYRKIQHMFKEDEVTILIRCAMRVINSLLLLGGGNPIASRGSLCSLGFMISFLIRIKRTLIFGF